VALRRPCRHPRARRRARMALHIHRAGVEKGQFLPACHQRGDCDGSSATGGSPTRRIDAFTGDGIKLLNFAPEAQCTPSRSALLTGRYAIRSGNHTVALPGDEGGLVAWERTMGDILSARGYATACVGKWHIGEPRGRWPTDHGFDEWYGPPRTWDETMWPSDPWYDPKRHGITNMLEARKATAGAMAEHTGWGRKFDEPIALPGRRVLVTLRDTATTSPPSPKAKSTPRSGRPRLKPSSWWQT
jgi:arylsulfatase A-like enzyme